MSATSLSPDTRTTSHVRIRRKRVAPGRLVLAAACAFFFLWPVVMVVVGVVRSGLPGTSDGGWSLDGLTDVFGSPSTYAVLGRTVVLALSVTVLSTLLAVFMSWIVARTDTPLRRLVTPTMVLVLATPPLFFAISWDMLGNPRVGLLNQAFTAFTGGTQGPFNVESWAGLILVSTLKAAAFSYFLILGPFMSMDRSMEEASLLSGASKARTFFRIHIPMLAPAISGAALLSMIAFLEAFDIPQVIGLPAGIRVLPTEVYNYINATSGGQYAQASSLALLLIAMVVVLIVIQAKMLGRRQFTTVSGKSYRTERWKLGRSRWACTAAIVLYVLLAVILPLIQLYLGSFQSLFGIFRDATLDNYRTALGDPEIVGAIRDTVYLSVLGGFVAMLAALVLARVIRTSRGPVTRFISGSVWMPMALPGIVLGLGIMWSYLSVPGLNKLYATLWILLIGLFVAAIPIAMRSAEGALAQIPDDLEEAAWISGASRPRAFIRMVVPLITPSFLSGWLLAGILISSNLAVPMLLASPLSNTMSVEVLKLYQSGEVTQAAAVFCIVLTGIAVVAVAALVLRAIVTRHNRRRGLGTGPAPDTPDTAPALTDVST